jgi:hypothetical protein
MKIVLLIMMFLLVGAFFIISNSNLHLANPEQRGVFTESYYDWFGKIFDNTKSVSGYVVNMDWLPSPELNQTK